MSRFVVTNSGQVALILRAFACLDDIRWSNAPNNVINYCSDDMTADEKLLTHWLSYIADRQMPFMRVWEVGGYVLSHLVRAFQRSGRDIRSLVGEYVRRRDEHSKQIILHAPKAGPNRRLELQGITEGPVQFASRYIPEDTFLMFRTLALLERTSGRRFAGFLAMFMSRTAGPGENIRRMAVVLDGLTYSAGRTMSADDLERNLQDLLETVTATADAIRANPSGWLESRRRVFRPFGKKRLWCSLRDYLKSPEFNPCFVQALADAGMSESHHWRRTSQELRQSLHQLELPGDVWSNNEIFANGLFTPYLGKKPKTWDMPRTVREIYRTMENELRGTFHPEQLDVTFDFVPRMCERQMCQVCLFGGGVESLCHQQPNLLCPVPLIACGYKHHCQPENCYFKSDTTKGVCRHWQALDAEQQ